MRPKIQPTEDLKAENAHVSYVLEEVRSTAECSLQERKTIQERQLRAPRGSLDAGVTRQDFILRAVRKPPRDSKGRSVRI